MNQKGRRVDPRAPRFGQAITAIGTLGGVALQEPVLIYLVTAMLVAPVASKWRLDPYAFLWKRGVGRMVGSPRTAESVLPHRFARLVGAVTTGLASICFVAAAVTGVDLAAIAGYAFATVVGGLAALGATTGFCLGCRMYREVAIVRDIGLLTSPADPVGRSQ